MAIDGFFVKKLINEIKEDVSNNRLQRVELIQDDIFLFQFYYKKITRNLIFKLNPPYVSFFLSDKLNSNRDLSSNFLVNLNKHLSGFILKGIKQHYNDRVVIFEFEGNDFLEGRVTKTLIFEIMGRYNNLILIEDEIVIDAFNKNISTNNRSIVPKVKYEFYPSNKKTIDSIDYSLVDHDLYLQKNYQGFSPILSKYLFNHNLSIEDFDVNPTLDLNSNKFYWFDLFDSDNKKHFNRLCLLIEHLMSNSYNVNDNRYLKFVKERLNSNIYRLNNTKENLTKANDDLKYSDYGNYIYSSGLNLNKQYSEFKSYDGKTIIVDSHITLLENAQDFYKRYEKAKRTINHLNNQVIELENNIFLFEQLLFDIENSNFLQEEINEVLIPFGFKTKKRYRKQRKPKINFTKIEYNNSSFYIGRNNIQNEYVTHTIGKHNDYWFHIKDKPGSHVVLKGELNDENLLFGSMLAGYFSKDKNMPVVSINYTQIKNLKKIPKLPGYQVILRSYQSINVKIDIPLIEEYLSKSIE